MRYCLPWPRTFVKYAVDKKLLITIHRDNRFRSGQLMTGEQVIELSKSYRPGSAHSWKVLHPMSRDVLFILIFVPFP